ncbi:uncharacterized protein LOC131181439 [Hevea brasiliensis]|uniref:uncharacterized protein LOC131181439 n=1 Tax=Hevea brasiliensis TaxID=3981 RepID=UPI0025D8ABFA|nr:uncharacterized protein LOC131181439 [Hevea brasiliensis]
MDRLKLQIGQINCKQNHVTLHIHNQQKIKKKIKKKGRRKGSDLRLMAVIASSNRQSVQLRICISLSLLCNLFKLITRALEAMIMSDQWAQYQEDDQGKTRFVCEKVADQHWWEQIDYILAFIGPIMT